MTIRFLTDGIWQRIRTLNKKRGKRFVAVPYLGSGATERLHLRAGDLLVIDVSEGTIKSGQTDPREVIRYISHGVEVHSVQNLHAKVFIFGQTAIVGSTNISSSSESQLVEAGIESTSRSIVESCVSFIKSLRGNFTGLEYAKRMRRFFKPRKFARRAKKNIHRSQKIVTQTDIWAVPLVLENWEAEDYVQEAQAKQKAKRKLRNPRIFEIDDFCWTGKGFLENLRFGHRVLMCTEWDNGQTMVTPPGRIVAIHRYSVSGRSRGIVCLEINKKFSTLPVELLQKEQRFLG